MIKIRTNKHYMGRDPFKDWILIVIVTGIISITLVVAGVSSYYAVNSAISEVPEPSSDQKLPFDENSLSNALKVLDDRANNQKTIINANIPLAPL